MKPGSPGGALSVLLALAVQIPSCNASLDFVTPRRGSGGMPGGGGVSDPVGAGGSGGVPTLGTGGSPGGVGAGLGGSVGGLGGGGLSGSGGAPGTCTADASCKYGLHCDVGNSQTCVECAQDLHCAGKVTTPYCNFILNRCVSCVASMSSQCPGGICVQSVCTKTCPGGSPVGCPASAPMCEDGGEGATATSICSACDDDVPCPTGQICLLSARACVGCINDLRCVAPGLPHCDPALHRCVQCTRSADCIAPAPSFCDVATGTCRSP